MYIYTKYKVTIFIFASIDDAILDEIIVNQSMKFDSCLNMDRLNRPSCIS
jgi:hypothetical protein